MRIWNVPKVQLSLLLCSWGGHRLGQAVLGHCSHTPTCSGTRSMEHGGVNGGSPRFLPSCLHGAGTLQGLFFPMLVLKTWSTGGVFPQVLEIERVKVMKICYSLKIIEFLMFCPSSLTPWSMWIHWHDKPDSLSTWPHNLGLYPGDFTGVKLTTGELFYCSLTAVQTYGGLQVKNN